jgi:hypothetical protein
MLDNFLKQRSTKQALVERNIIRPDATTTRDNVCENIDRLLRQRHTKEQLLKKGILAG